MLSLDTTTVLGIERIGFRFAIRFSFSKALKAKFNSKGVLSNDRNYI